MRLQQPPHACLCPAGVGIVRYRRTKQLPGQQVRHHGEHRRRWSRETLQTAAKQLNQARPQASPTSADRGSDP